MITFEALDVILRVQNLRGFQAQMKSGVRSVRSVGAAAVSESKSTSAAMVSAAKKATAGLLGVSAAAAVVGFNQSVEFEKQMTMIQTQAGATREELEMFKPQVLELAKLMPQGPIELAKGLYHARSIGVQGAEAMDLLKVAAEGAAVGAADLEDTTTALGSAWLAGIHGVHGFRNTMAVMNATVGAGNMRMDELVTALGTGVLPTAKLAGLEIQDVMAALALLKDEGYGAYGAMAQFATALHFFTSPTDKATRAFKRLGLGQLEIAETMRKHGMVAALALLRDRLNEFTPDLTKQEKIMGAILPGGRGRVFRVLFNQIDRYQMKIDQINRTSGQFDKAIEKTHQTAAFKLHAAWSSLQVALIELGDVIRNQGVDVIIFAIKVLTAFVKVLADIPDIIQAIVEWWDHLPGIVKLSVQFVAIFLGQIAMLWMMVRVLRAIYLAWIAIKYGIMIVRGALILLTLGSGPLMIAILAVIALIVLMVLHWKDVKKYAGIAWQWIKTAAQNTLDWLKQAWRDFRDFFVNMWHWIVDQLRPIVQWIDHNLISPVEDFVGGVKQVVGGGAKTNPALRGVSPRLIPRQHPGGATGAYVRQAGFMEVGERGREIVYVPGGASVSPLFRGSENVPHTTKDFDPGPAFPGRGGGSETHHHHLYLDGKQFAEVVTKHIENRKARR